MLVSTAVCLFLIAWTSAFLADYFLRHYNVRRYINFADHFGFTISPFQLRCYTSRSHEGLSSRGGKHQKSTAVCMFYSFGAVAALVSQAIVTVYLSRLLWHEVMAWLFPPLPTPHPPSVKTIPPVLLEVTPAIRQSSDDAGSGLVPIIPGVNLPLSHVPIFMAVLIVAAVLHELGHGWAARTHGVKVNGFGLFVIAIYPGAFTDIDTESLERSSAWTRLQIFSAGIWHNLLLALFAFFVFSYSSVLLSTVFHSGAGVVITDVSSASGLYGGLKLGDVVVGIDECQVRSNEDWRSCIQRRRRSYGGNCVNERVLVRAATEKIEMTANEIHCCENATSSHLCFEAPAAINSASFINIAAGVVVPAKKKEPSETTLYSCLNARRVLEGENCNKTSSCSAESDRCVYAGLFNGTHLVSIHLESGPDLLFVGHFDELLYLVSASDLSPRFTRLPFSILSPLWLPQLLDLLTKYFLSLSLALGALNALPCFALDGQFILYTLIHSGLRRFFPKRRRSCMLRVLLCYGTSLLFGNVLVGFLRLFRSL